MALPGLPFLLLGTGSAWGKWWELSQLAHWLWCPGLPVPETAVTCPSMSPLVPLRAQDRVSGIRGVTQHNTGQTLQKTTQRSKDLAEGRLAGETWGTWGRRRGRGRQLQLRK